MEPLNRTLENVKQRAQHGERLLILDAARDARNIRASLKLMLLVLASSAAMGIAATVFLRGLEFVTSLREAHLWLFALIPLVTVGTAWVYRRYGKESALGNNLVIESAVTGKHIPLRMAPLILIATWATHLVGGSAGREGTAVQMGGAIAENIGQRFKLAGHDHEALVLSGISAAFGAVFGTPLAGAFFGLEMCFVGRLDYRAVLYCLAASFTGDAVGLALGCEHAFQTIRAIPHPEPYPVIIALVAAFAFGVAARLFSAGIRAVKRFYAHRFQSYLLAALVASLVVLGVYLGFGWQRYGGLSEWLVGAGFAGETSIADSAIKLLMTSLTLGSGMQGGEVTPLFCIGSSLGGWIGAVSGIEPSFLAALGLVSVFGAATNAPLTTIMLGIDMFGGEAAPWFVMSAFVSYFVAGHRGIYPAQRILAPKRRSLAGDASLTVGQAIERHDQEQL